MLVKKPDAVMTYPVQDEGAEKARMAILIGPEEGAPNFVMRRIELDAGGCTPFHSHPWEHVVFILKGSGKLRGENAELDLVSGASVFVKPGEQHQFAADKHSPLTFLCSIPRR